MGLSLYGSYGSFIIIQKQNVKVANEKVRPHPDQRRPACNVRSSVARGGRGGWKMENSPPHLKTAPLKRLNLRNWTKYQSQFW